MIVCQYSKGYKHMNLKHLNFRIDKPRFRMIANSWKWKGEYYQWKRYEQEDKWFQSYPTQGEDDSITEVEHMLGIHIFETKPRFYWLEENSDIPIHYDEDNVTSIQINLMEQTPSIGIEGVGDVPYEAMVINNGKIRHWVDPVPYERLQLKFVMRESYDQVLRVIPDALI